MPANVNNLNWQSTSAAKGANWVALVPCAAADGVTNISVTGAWQDSDHNIIPAFLTVDNIANNGTPSIQIGPLIFTVTPYSRKIFPIPDNTRNVTVTVAVGSVNVWLSEKEIAPDDSNQLLVQQTAVKTLIYGYVSYNVGPQLQQAADQNSQIVFAPTIADMVYNLLPVAATPVGNGWFQFVRNVGTKKVSITPTGGDTLNTFFTAATPLVLNPGDGGIISSDGTNWYYQGKLTWQSADTAMAAAPAGSTVFTHNLGLAPATVAMYLRNTITNLTYVVGDIVQLFPEAMGGAANNIASAIVNPTTSQLTFVTNSAFGQALPNKTTGTNTTIAAADWNYFLRAEVQHFM